MPDPAQNRRLERLTFLPVIGALGAMWAATGWLTFSEKEFTLERATAELRSTVMTLADFNEFAELATGPSIASTNERRREAMWRALLDNPTTSIWVEKDGQIEGEQPPGNQLDASIVIEEPRAGFTFHAALPQADALADWRRSTLRRVGLMAGISAAFLLLTQVLLRNMRQRAAAEREVAAARERETQLARYKTELEEQVALRTSELKESSRLLEKELRERQAAENELQQHDALLHTVTRSAAELLGSHSHEDAAVAVLELIAQTVGVGRAQITEFATNEAGHLCGTIRHEWCAPGINHMIDHPAFQTYDMTSELPQVASRLLAGKLTAFSIDDLEGNRKKLLEDAEMKSFLQIPVHVEDRLWGSIDFIDSTRSNRKWNWAETDTLQTLAELVGASITKARYLKELADANMIVQNSPTILYRVRGEPPFPLIYVSHNITKYGYDPKTLTNTENWVRLLMEPDDEAKLIEAMARSLDKEASSASIEFRLRTENGSNRWVENRYTPVRDEQGRLIEIEGMIIDITERKAAEEKIAHLARTDALTGLANRATFIERIRQAFSSSKRGAPPFAILYLDLDHFKPINDTFGHPVGDKLLREVANRLRESTRENDVVARLGGDEFAVLQTDMQEPANAGALAATLQKAIALPYSIDGSEMHVSASIGICPFDSGSTSPDSMLAQADLALYRSKEEGRNCYRFHTDDLDSQVFERVTLSEDLRNAIDRGELELYYQPQVALKTRDIVGMEAFVRWHHPTRGLLAASAFVPVAEKTGTIVPLGQWVLDQACRQMRLWRDQDVAPPVVTLNLSLAQLKNSAELLKDVRTALEKYRLEPSELNFDVTEATLAQITLMRNDVLGELRRIGVGISIDNFGGEYSSLDYLRTYGVSHLKITSSYMDGASDDPNRSKTIRAIINFARDLGIGVVTEGVETQEQLDVSSATSVIAQGFYFSDALEPDEAQALLKIGTIRKNESGQVTSESPDIERSPRRQTK